MLKGWKTLAFNVAIAVFGVLQAADWVDLLGSERAGVAVTVIGVVGFSPAIRDHHAGGQEQLT
jgi:hypothetical protein